MSVARRLVPLCGLIVLLLVPGGWRPAAAAGSESTDPLWIDPSERDFSENPALLQRILSSPHGYLRFINVAFSQEVCREFADAVDGAPLFNLHGDAHLEQYAVTDLGRGLTDFDDSSQGPAVVDLVRLGTSLHLAADQRGWTERAGQLYREFLRGYRGALEDPSLEAPEPTVVRRLAARFEHDREKYFEWVETISDPVPPAEAEALIAALGPYVEDTRSQHPELGARHFEAVDLGYLRLGIGSALDRKYLVRIRGQTDEPTDDLVLELKQVRDLTGIDCILAGRGNEPFRILIGQSRIAYQPYDLLGYVRFEGLTFWIHAWVDNYAEVSIGDSFRSPEELAQVVFDIGVQLGRGHPNQIAAPLDEQLRREQLRRLARDQRRLERASRELADRVTRAWRSFHKAYAD